MNISDSVLIIDDEVQIRRLLEITLSSNDFNTYFAADGKQGLIAAATHNPSLIILDLGLPDIDGQELLLKLREWFTKPVIVLSVRNSEEEIIKALDNGANDYLTKPFRSGELIARIRAAIRLSRESGDKPVIESGSLNIDMINHVVRKNGEILKLTSTEFTLLTLLAKNQGCVLTHQHILREIWGYGYLEQTQYLRVFIAQLRKKIEDNPSNPTLLITESGIGYRFGN
ncbi:MAG TPA: response regulator [Bacteroidales bacterium]|jgi:two-component system KDP operon response regulator KdpE|nr:response regulator [Bacteroidales bacterium]HOX73097.1 response regulator [Bacteroidales bacterium]HPM86409.1 response regulator [Bacteroidales bacterium]HQM69020.1 response regulator [Bacteroidales bacterium]